MINKIINWKQREGLMNEYQWLSLGIQLYRERLQKDPGDAECMAALAKLLIRSGTDEKMRYMNLIKAQELFSEVLALYQNDAEALYRLGHISYEHGEYENCIHYFLRALDQPLSQIRAFRAFSTASKAYFHLGDEENALAFLEKAEEIDQERNFTTEINETKTLLTQKGTFRRIVTYSDGTSQFITLQEVEQLKGETANDDEAELDVSHFHPTFTGPEAGVRLERKEAEILQYLIERNNRYISREELLNIWEEDDAPELDTIKTYISKIKRKLKECFSEESGPIIHSKRGQGYRWTCKVATKVIKVL